MSSTKSPGSSSRSSCSQERDLRVGRRRRRRRARSPHRPRAPRRSRRRPSRGSVATARVRADLGAERRARSTAIASRDRAHAALGHRPRAEVAVADVADRVVRHDVAGAGLVRARPRPDQAVQRHHGLDLVGLEEPVEDVDDRHRHQARDVADSSARRARGTARRAGAARAGRHGRFDPTRGRRRHQQRAEHVGQAADPRVPPLDRVGVALARTSRTPRSSSARRRRTARCSAPVGERQEVRADRGAPGSRARSSWRSRRIVSGIRLIT